MKEIFSGNEVIARGAFETDCLAFERISHDKSIVKLSAVSQRLNIAEEFWMGALEKMVPPKALEINKKAFQISREL